MKRIIIIMLSLFTLSCFAKENYLINASNSKIELVYVKCHIYLDFPDNKREEKANCDSKEHKLTIPAKTKIKSPLAYWQESPSDNSKPIDFDLDSIIRLSSPSNKFEPIVYLNYQDYIENCPPDKHTRYCSQSPFYILNVVIGINADTALVFDDYGVGFISAEYKFSGNWRMY